MTGTKSEWIGSGTEPLWANDDLFPKRNLLGIKRVEGSPGKILLILNGKTVTTEESCIKFHCSDRYNSVVSVRARIGIEKRWIIIGKDHELVELTRAIGSVYP